MREAFLRIHNSNIIYDVVDRHGQYNCMICSTFGECLAFNKKQREDSFSPLLTIRSHLPTTMMPESSKTIQDSGITVVSRIDRSGEKLAIRHSPKALQIVHVTDKPITLPLAHAHGVNSIACHAIANSVPYTVKPLNSGHIGGRTLVHCGEVVPLLEVD